MMDFIFFLFFHNPRLIFVTSGENQSSVKNDKGLDKSKAHGCLQQNLGKITAITRLSNHFKQAWCQWCGSLKQKVLPDYPQNTVNRRESELQLLYGLHSPHLHEISQQWSSMLQPFFFWPAWHWCVQTKVRRGVFCMLLGISIVFDNIKFKI